MLQVGVLACGVVTSFGVTNIKLAKSFMKAKIMKTLYWNILVLAFLSLTGLNVVNADIDDGLISAWLFDGNLRDSVGNNDGEFMGSSTLPVRPTSKPGPVDTDEGIISTWTFEGNAEDSVSDNDGELMTGKAKPANKPAGDKDKSEGKSGPVNINDGIVSTWTFDGDTEDDIEDNDGEINGAPLKSGPVYVDGKFGRALKFDGVDDYVQIPDDESLHFPEGMTVTAWMYVEPGGNLNLDHAAICAKARMIGWSSDYSWRVATTSTTGMTWGRCTGDTEGWFATDGVIPGTEEWVHVALTSQAPDAATPIRVYVNGEDVTDVSGQGGMNTPPPYSISEGIPVEIGVGRAQGGTVGNDSFFSGRIDEVGIWNRGLNAGEIEEVMTKGLPYSYSVNAHNKIATTWGSLK